MNKKAVDDQLEIAYQSIIDSGIAQKGEEPGAYLVDKAYRGQISTFGAAIIMGSLKSAIAFFSEDGNASIKRSLLIKAIENILKKRKVMHPGQTLFDYAKNESPAVRENIINAAIAVKLALNLFILIDKK